jgi:hypothetical protein
MTTSVNRPIRAAAILVLFACGAALAMRPPTVAASAATYQGATPSIPDRLSDTEFWSLVSDISEPGGFFRITDNFTSNELEVGRVFTMLRERGVSGGVYLGVGPGAEPDFTSPRSVPPWRSSWTSAPGGDAAPDVQSQKN